MRPASHDNSILELTWNDSGIIGYVNYLVEKSRADFLVEAMRGGALIFVVRS